MPASVLLLIASVVPAADLSALFDSTTKDFGQVPRGSVNVHRFVLTNTTNAPIHVYGLRSSCKCATPRALTDTAAPGEQLSIEVAYDSTTFVGARSMTITVTFDRPSFQEVTLRVSGYSRQDVVFRPGRVDFGVVAKGTPAKRTVEIEYAGNQDWRLADVVTAEPLQASVQELSRTPGKVLYRVDVALEPSAPPGLMAQTLQLKTNDPSSPVLRISANATVQAMLSASPSELDLGTVDAGQTVVRKVLVRGEKPFVVDSVTGQTNGVKVLSTQGSRKVHVVNIEFTPSQAGTVEQSIKLNTDMEGEDPLSLRITATVP